MLVFIVILLFINLLFISITDIEKAEIWHSNTIILLILGVLYGFYDKQTNWFFLLSLFLTIFITQFIFFIIFGENAIGGGDVKIISISILFLHNFQDIIVYSISLFILSIIGIIYCKLKKESHLRYGPYLSLALLFTVLNANLNLELIWTNICLFILYMMIIHQVFFSERSFLENVKNNQLFKI